MKGKIVLTMKRWWLTVVVFTLALSLTSCSKKKLDEDLQSGDEGFTQCDGTNEDADNGTSMGNFDVRLFRSQGNPGMYELIITPFQVDAGTIASITIANGNKSFKKLVLEVVLNPSEEINVPLLTESDVINFDILAITQHDLPFTNVLQGLPISKTLCTLNLPANLSGPEQQ